MRAQPMIAVADVPATSLWFQTVLGFESAHGGDEYEQLMSGGQLVLQLHNWDIHEHPYLGRKELTPYGNGVLLWFESDQVEADYERACQAGAEMLEPLHINPRAAHLEFWLRDPNGYVVVVASPYGDLGSFAQTEPVP